MRKSILRIIHGCKQWRIQKILVGGDLEPKPQKFGCLHQNWDWFFGRNRKFKRFFRPKSGGLQKKKKKGLHQNWDWFFGRNRKFKRFFRPKSGGLQKKKKKKKKKKVFTKIETDFSAEFGNSNDLFAHNQVVSKKKKKKVFAKIETDFSAGFVTFRSVGGDASRDGAELFKIRADFSAKIVTFRLVGGDASPPSPPPKSATGCKFCWCKKICLWVAGILKTASKWR